MRRRRVGIAVAVVVAASGWGWPDPPTGFARIKADWVAARRAANAATEAADGLAAQRRAWAERAPKPAEYIARCLKLADERPGTSDELAALVFAFNLTADPAQAERIAARLSPARLAKADLADVYAATFGLDTRTAKPGTAAITRAVFERVKPDLDRPAPDSKAVRVLARLCILAAAQQAADPPPLFAEAAELVVGRFADHDEIHNFSEALHSLSGQGPTWAGRYERHLRTVLEKNRAPSVRAVTRNALAGILAARGETGTAAALTEYRALVAEFAGEKHGLVSTVRGEAERMIEELTVRAPGSPAPEIEGEDTDGKPFALSDYRGKVVLLDFWGFW